MNTFIDLPILTIHNIVQYLTINDYIALIGTCRHVYDCINIPGNKYLYKIIFNNSIIQTKEEIYSIYIDIINNRFTRTESYINYGNKKILHGEVKVIDIIDRAIVSATYDNNKLIRGIVKDNLWRHIAIYIDTIGHIKIKYYPQLIYIIHKGIYWRLDFEDKRLLIIKYIYKTKYANYITYYDDKNTVSISRFDINKRIPTPSHILQNMKEGELLTPIIFDIINTTTELFKINPFNEYVTEADLLYGNYLIRFDYVGNIKYTKDYKTGNEATYKDNERIKYVTFDEYGDKRIYDIKHNIGVGYINGILNYSNWKCDEYGYTYWWSPDNKTTRTTYKINNIEYIWESNANYNITYYKKTNGIISEITKEMYVESTEILNTLPIP